MTWSSAWGKVKSGAKVAGDLGIAAAGPGTDLLGKMLSGDLSGSKGGGNIASATNKVNINATLINSAIVNQSVSASTRSTSDASIFIKKVSAASACIDNKAVVQVLATAKSVSVSQSQINQTNSYAATLSQAADSLSKGPPVGNKATSDNESGMNVLSVNDTVANQVDTCTSDQETRSNITLNRATFNGNLTVVNQPNVYSSLLATCNQSVASKVSQLNKTDITVTQQATAKAIGANSLSSVFNIFLLIMMCMIIVGILTAIMRSISFVSELALGVFVVVYFVLYIMMYGTTADDGQSDLVQFVFELFGLHWPKSVIRDFAPGEKYGPASLEKDVDRSGFSRSSAAVRKQREEYFAQTVRLSRPYVNRQPLIYSRTGDSGPRTQELDTQQHMAGYEQWQQVAHPSGGNALWSYDDALKYAQQAAKGDDAHAPAFAWVRDTQYEADALRHFVNHYTTSPNPAFTTKQWFKDLKTEVDALGDQEYQFPARADEDMFVADQALSGGDSAARAAAMMRFRIIQMHSLSLPSNKPNAQGRLYRADCLLTRASLQSDGTKVEVDGNQTPQGYDGYAANDTLGKALQCAGEGSVPDADSGINAVQLRLLYANCFNTARCGLVPVLNTGTTTPPGKTRSGSALPPGTDGSEHTDRTAGWQTRAFPVSKSIVSGQFFAMTDDSGAKNPGHKVDDAVASWQNTDGVAGTCTLAVVLGAGDQGAQTAYVPRAHDVSGGKGQGLASEIVKIYTPSTVVAGDGYAYPHGAGVVDKVTYQPSPSAEQQVWFDGKPSAGCQVYQIHNYEGFVQDTQRRGMFDPKAQIYDPTHDQWFKTGNDGTLNFADPSIDLLPMRARYFASMVPDESAPAGPLNPNGVIGTIDPPKGKDGKEPVYEGADYAMTDADLVDTWTPMWMIGGKNSQLGKGAVGDNDALAWKPQGMANSVTWFTVRDTGSFPLRPPTGPTDPGTTYGPLMEQKLVWMSCQIFFMLVVCLVVIIVQAVMLGYGMWEEWTFLVSLGVMGSSSVAWMYFLVTWVKDLAEVDVNSVSGR